MPTMLPTPQDAALLMQDTTTKIVNFQSAGFDLGNGFAPGGVGRPAVGVVNVTAIDVASGNEIYLMTMEESVDNVTFTPAGAATAATALGAIAVRGWITKRYVRLSLSLSGTTPSITFKAWLNPLP